MKYEIKEVLNNYERYLNIYVGSQSRRSLIFPNAQKPLSRQKSL